MKILAVDDDPIALDILGECLAQAGHEHVTLETSAKRAFDMLRETSIAYDCVLLDIDMPERDGIELCADIRRLDRYRNAPILMITKHMEQAVVERAFAAGATDYVTKPFAFVEAVTRIRVAHALVQERRAALDSYLALQNSVGQPAVGRASVRKSKDMPPVMVDEEQHISGENLLALPVFRNYLEQAAREDKAKIHLTAIKAQYISRVFELTSSDEFLEFLKMFAKAINEELVAGGEVPGASKAFRAQIGQSIRAKSVTLRLNGKDLETKQIKAGESKIVFETKLTKGKHELSPFFNIPEGELGAYYAVIKTK